MIVRITRFQPGLCPRWRSCARAFGPCKIRVSQIYLSLKETCSGPRPSHGSLLKTLLHQRIRKVVSDDSMVGVRICMASSSHDLYISQPIEDSLVETGFGLQPLHGSYFPSLVHCMRCVTIPKNGLLRPSTLAWKLYRHA